MHGGQPMLVLFQGDNYGFSWSVSVQGKARLAANGLVLSKRRNAAMSVDRPNPSGASVVSRCCVAVLDKDYGHCL
ncbi:MAG: hypothetical protein RQ982_12900, partial [Gammaproteobacteria bacterium]|nr:hypothetical protein [Gammaproteobacteria bacterium]